MPASESESVPGRGSRLDPTPASSPRAHEDHLRELGLPMMVSPGTRLRELLPRCAGFAAGLTVVGVGLAALDRSNELAIAFLDRFEDDLETVAPDDPSDPGVEISLLEPHTPELAAAAEPILELLVVAVALFLLAPLLGWVVGRVSRRIPRPAATALGLVSLLALVVVPAVSFSLSEGLGFRGTVIAAAVVAGGTYLGVGSLVRWTARRVAREVGTMGPMVARVLPILMLAVLFLFFSAEIWQVMVALSWPRTFALVGVMVALTVLLVGITTHDDINRELADWSSDTPLRPAELVNVVLVPVLATLIQSILFATLVFAFFVFLGWIAVPEATESRWTTGPRDTPEGLLFGLPFTVTLVRVALTLGAFSALNLAASAASDPAHHERFVRPMIDEVLRGLDARESYLGSRRRTGRRAGERPAKGGPAVERPAVGGPAVEPPAMERRRRG